MILGRLHRGRLARTKLFVNLKESFLSVSSLVLLQDSLLDTLIFSVLGLDLLVGPCFSDSTQKRGKRDLSVLIYSYIDNVVGIHFIFKPRTTVRDNGGLEKILTGLVFVKGIIYTGRTNQL